MDLCIDDDVMKCGNGSYGVSWRNAPVKVSHLWFCLFVALALITGLGDSPDELDFSRGWVAGLEYFGVWIFFVYPSESYNEWKYLASNRNKNMTVNVGNQVNSYSPSVVCVVTVCHRMDAWRHQNLNHRISGRPQNILYIRPGIP